MLLLCSNNIKALTRITGSNQVEAANTGKALQLAMRCQLPIDKSKANFCCLGDFLTRPGRISNFLDEQLYDVYDRLFLFAFDVVFFV